MSASFYMKQKKNDGIRLSVSGKSDFIESMNKLFGEAPWVINDDNIRDLKTLSVVMGLEDDLEAAFELYDKIDGALEIWYEY